MSTLLLWGHLVASVILFWSCFCRLVIVSKARTRLNFRISIYLLALAASAEFLAPLFWGHQVSLWETSLIGAIAIHQIISSALWRYGTPSVFTKEAHHD
jgi:hypothetical protein